jgi:hypothetical protein
MFPTEKSKDKTQTTTASDASIQGAPAGWKYEGLSQLAFAEEHLCCGIRHCDMMDVEVMRPDAFNFSTNVVVEKNVYQHSLELISGEETTRAGMFS